MYKTTILIFALISTLFCSNIKGQSSDSLRKILNNTEIDSVRINTLIKIAENQSENDSALFYAEEALKLSESIENEEKSADIYMLLSYIYSDIEFSEKIVFYLKKAEKYYKTTNNNKKLVEIYKNIGLAYETEGDYGNAGIYYLKALKIIETLDDNEIELARILNNIGSIYYKQEQFDGALKYWKRSLAILKKNDFKVGIAIVTSNIGNVYFDKYNYSNDTITKKELIATAQKHYQNALAIYESINDSNNVYHTYNSLGNLYITKKNKNKALMYYKKAIIIARKLNNSQYEVISFINISKVFSDFENYSKSIEYLKKAKKIAKENDFKPLLLDIYSNLSYSYEEIKKYRLSLNMMVKYDSLNKVVYNENIAEAYAKNEKKYNYERREKENEKLKIANQLQEEKNTKQRLLLIASIIGLTLLSFLAIAILRGYRQKRRANELLEKQKTQILDKNTKLVNLNEEISSQRDEIEAQRDEIEAQRDLVYVQKEQIENIHTEVTHSIKYAQRIQTSILPKKTILDNNFTDSFVLFKPKDVVSGDFYWFTHSEEEDITIATAADCTGHGVPGAFMSMLGVSFLKEIVNKEYITNTGLILKKLRKEIINALQQKGETGEQKDGMDMALIAFNHKTKVLQFSGANNPVYIVSDELNITSEGTEFKTFLDENNEKGKNLFEIKPDKMPIAIYLKMDRFKTHEIKLKEGDMVYMSSDGYADQFGGPKGKKLKYKPFKRLLLENSCKDLEFQHNELDKYIEDWKAYTDQDGEVYEQVDDICIVGLKI